MCLGIPGQIVAISDPVKKLGIADVAGVRREINLACIVSAEHPLASCVGDWVLIHVGFAMSSMDEEQARKRLARPVELGEAQAQAQAAARPLASRERERSASAVMIRSPSSIRSSTGRAKMRRAPRAHCSTR